MHVSPRLLNVKTTEEIFTTRFMPLYPRLYSMAVSILDKIVADRNMELLVETSEPKEAVEIYAISSKKSEVVKEILIKCIEPSECSVVYMKGNFPVAELIEHPEDLIN